MSIKHRLVTVLLGIYPARWRREYGGELKDLLLTGPLGLGTIGDVVSSGVCQRLRSLEPATVFGLVAMAAILMTLSWNIVAPQPYGTGWTTLLEPSDMTFPTIRIRPLVSELYAALPDGVRILHASAARHHAGEIGHGGDEGLLPRRPADHDRWCPDASGRHARDRIGAWGRPHDIPRARVRAVVLQRASSAARVAGRSARTRRPPGGVVGLGRCRRIARANDRPPLRPAGWPGNSGSE